MNRSLCAILLAACDPESADAPGGEEEEQSQADLTYQTFRVDCGQEDEVVDLGPIDVDRMLSFSTIELRGTRWSLSEGDNSPIEDGRLRVSCYQGQVDQFRVTVMFEP